MSGIKPFITLAIITALGVLGIASARAGGHEGDRKEKEGYVVPCSLAGVNPVYHPEIFGNPPLPPENMVSSNRRMVVGM